METSRYPDPSQAMTRSQALHDLGNSLYGPGLLARVYISELARNLDLSPAVVRRWWYGLDAEGAPDWEGVIERVPCLPWPLAGDGAWNGEQQFREMGHLCDDSHEIHPGDRPRYAV